MTVHASVNDEDFQEMGEIVPGMSSRRRKLATAESGPHDSTRRGCFIVMVSKRRETMDDI